MMSSEEKDLTEHSVLGQTNRSRRMPVASANGSQMAHLRDGGTSRRKRVRISTSDPVKERENRRLGDHYVANDNSLHSAKRSISDRGDSHADHQGDIADDGRSGYAKRYQMQREEGNFDYHYNKVNRTQSVASRGRTDHTRTNISSMRKKKMNKPKREQSPQEPVKYKENITPDIKIRLNKFLANSGVCSRREADELILKGVVTVNGKVVTELGSRVTSLDVVEYQGKRIETESKVYVLLNKPKNCVTTSDDPECRLTVMDLVKNACTERIYPVGRLDRHTTGVLLITNDGELASKLTHPSYLKKKIYHVWLDRAVTMEDMQLIADGIELEDGEIHADALSYVKEDDLSQVGIEIHSGRNRIIRRIFEHLGYRVIKLDRVYFAGLTKKNLPRGRWRYLNEQEVNNLRMGAFE